MLMAELDALGEDSDDFDDEDGDDAFMREFRAKRLQGECTQGLHLRCSSVGHGTD